MKKFIFPLIAMFVVLGCQKNESTKPALTTKLSVNNLATVAVASGFTNIFYDGFDAGSAITSKWAIETGADPNSSICNYSSSVPQIGSVDNTSSAIITATKNGTANSYTARGEEMKFEARIKLIAISGGTFKGFAQTNGAWPAFWVVNGYQWPTHGEIDFMEGYSHAGTANATKFTSNVFYGTTVNQPFVGPNSAMNYPANFNPEGWHTYTCYWKNVAYGETVRYYVDGTLISTVTNNTFPGLRLDYFVNHNIVLNLNVGCTSYTPLFQNNTNLNLFDKTQMWVDYVAVDKQTL
jgi:hypothetical protein